MRIAIAGFQHETNTFAPARADFADFEKADAWPGLTRGQAIIDEMAGMNLPITGFVEAARAAGAELVPLLWCSAEPCSIAAIRSLGGAKVYQWICSRQRFMS